MGSKKMWEDHVSKLSKVPQTTKAKNKIHKVMSEYKSGTLNIGKSKKKVKSRKQAIAIALDSARKKK